MPDYPDFQIVLYHCLKASGYQLGAGGTTVPTTVDYARSSLPNPIPAGASLRIKTTIFDDQARTKYHDFTNITKAYCYGLPIGSSAAPTLLDEGTVTGVTPTNGECLFVIPKETIPEDWASWEDGVRIWFEFYDTDSKLHLYQDIEIISMTYDSSVDYPETEDIPITTQDVTGADTVDLPAVVDGKVRIRLDMTAGNYALTLHSAAHVRAAGEIEIVIVKGTGTCSVTLAGVETISETAGAQTIQGVGSNMTLIKFDGDWILMNPSLGVD